MSGSAAALGVFNAVAALEVQGPTKEFSVLLAATSIETGCRDLAAKSPAGEIGPWLAQRCADAFGAHCVAPFLTAVSTATMSETKVALEKLRRDFDNVRHLVARLGFGFGDWSLTAAFEVAVRIDLVSMPSVTNADDGDEAPPLEMSTGEVLLELDGPDVILPAADADDNGDDETASTQPLLAFLQRYGKELLTLLELPNGNLLAHRESTLADLHALGIPQLSAVRRLWIGVASAAVSAKVQAMGQDLYLPAVDMLLDWKERVIDAFAEIAICNQAAGAVQGTGGADRSFRTEWSSRFADSLLTELGRCRIAAFFDMVVDYPDSAPALGDLARCMRRVPSLHRLLIQGARHVLAVRLHHAGTRTEDVLAILVSSIRALSALYARGEASAAVAEVCGATLEHLRKRRDAVPVLVRDMTAPPGSNGGAGSQVLQQFHHAEGEDGADDVTPARGGGPSGTRGGPTGPQADVLRVLLGALSLPAVVREYRNSLAQSLLAASPGDDHIDACSEVLERMKCIFGEDVLSQCGVMLRDVETSKRVGTWLNDFWRRPTSTPPAFPTRLTILSGTCWPTHMVKPPPPEETFEPHPTLQGMMQCAATSFKTMKPSQGLKFHHAHGFVSLTFAQTQRQTNRRVETVESVSIALGTIVLHLAHGANVGSSSGTAPPGSSSSKPAAAAAVPLDVLAREMKCSRAFIEATIQPVVPRLLVVTNGAVAVQPFVVTGESQFEEVEQADGNEPPAFISPEDLAVFATMCQAILKTGGSKSAAQIENSIRMFGKFQGTAAQAKELLLYLANQGKIATADGGATFTVAKRT